MAESNREPYEKLRTALRWTWSVPVVVALYVGWTILSRTQEARRVQQQQQEQQRQRQRTDDQIAVESMGGDRLEILHFYGGPGVIRRGERVQLCYGVSNAKTVRLEPQSNPVWPSYSRCLNDAPRKDTTYTLTIEDGKGNSRTATVQIKVR